MDLVIEDVQINGRETNIGVEDGVIVEVGDLPDREVDTATKKHDATGCVAVPGLRNGHTHAAMTLFRGYGDDMPLQEWLEEKIWPIEEKLSPEDVYWGTRLACLEMIRTGTIFFNDMYWEYEAVVEAVRDSGLKAMLSGVFIDKFDPNMAAEQRQKNEKRFRSIDERPDRIQFALGPHSIYTVSPESLEWVAEFSREHDLPVHIHLSETQHEVQECVEQHGKRPVHYLDDLGFLHEDVIAAHGIWVNGEELDLLSERGVSVVYNPVSNLKLNSGMEFPYQEYQKRNIDVCLGTDGAASNNNLNLFEEIKLSALLQKSLQDDPTVLPAGEALDLATANASRIFTGEEATLEEGKSADILLVEKDQPSMNPLHSEESQFAYSMQPDAIRTVICDGEVVMEDRTVQDEQEIYEKVDECLDTLIQE